MNPLNWDVREDECKTVDAFEGRADLSHRAALGEASGRHDLRPRPRAVERETVVGRVRISRGE
jgi:hypothetical protein